jgi:hypothetical protein
LPPVAARPFPLRVFDKSRLTSNQFIANQSTHLNQSFGRLLAGLAAKRTVFRTLWYKKEPFRTNPIKDLPEALRQNVN